MLARATAGTVNRGSGDRERAAGPRAAGRSVPALECLRHGARPARHIRRTDPRPGTSCAPASGKCSGQPRIFDQPDENPPLPADQPLEYATRLVEIPRGYPTSESPCEKCGLAPVSGGWSLNAEPADRHSLHHVSGVRIGMNSFDLTAWEPKSPSGVVGPKAGQLGRKVGWRAVRKVVARLEGNACGNGQGMG